MEGVAEITKGFRPNAKVFIEKTPHNIKTLDAILMIFPKAKIIVVHRDYRDVVVSFSRNLKTAGKSIETNIDYVASVLDMYYDVKGKVPKNQLLEIKFENIIKSPAKEFKRILSFLEVDNTVIVHKGLLNTGIAHIGQWRKVFKHRELKYLRNSELWKHLVNLGYERGEPNV